MCASTDKTNILDKSVINTRTINAHGSIRNHEHLSLLYSALLGDSKASVSSDKRQRIAQTKTP